MWVRHVLVADRYDLNTNGGKCNRGTPLWIGANDAAIIGSIEWVPAGNLVDFDDWDHGQPNDKAGDQGPFTNMD